MKVYDGESVSATLINGQGYCGSGTPPAMTSTANNLYIVFQTNGGTTGTGFVLSYTSCKYFKFYIIRLPNSVKIANSPDKKQIYILLERDVT